MKAKVVRRVAVIAVVAVAAAAAGVALLSFRSVPIAGGVLDINLGAPSQYLNPLLATTDTDRAITGLVFRGLTTRDTNGRIVPDLARDWSVSKSGETYTFRLNPRIQWQSGKPVTAADVQFSYDLLKSPGFPRTVISGMGSRYGCLGRISSSFDYPVRTSPFCSRRPSE